MSAIPGLAILLLSLIGAARVIKVSLVGARRAVRRVRSFLARVLAPRPEAPRVDHDALVEALLARLVTYRGGSAVQPAARAVAPDAGDTVIDMPRQRRAS